MNARKHRWDNLPVDRPMPHMERRRVVGKQAMLSHVRLSKGFIIASHHHPNEQFAVVLSGRVRFGLGAEGSTSHVVVDAVEGDVVELPSGVPHSAEALEDSIILDVFSPPSERTGVDGPSRG